MNRSDGLHVRHRMNLSRTYDLSVHIISPIKPEGAAKCRRTVGKDTFPTAPGEGGGEVRFVWGLIVAEPDLGWRIMIVNKQRGGQAASALTSRYMRWITSFGGKCGICGSASAMWSVNTSMNAFHSFSACRNTGSNVVCQVFGREERRRRCAPFSLNLRY